MWLNKAATSNDTLSHSKSTAQSKKYCPTPKKLGCVLSSAPTTDDVTTTRSTVPLAFFTLENRFLVPCRAGSMSSFSGSLTPSK
jgi:hypothetical protein